MLKDRFLAGAAAGILIFAAGCAQPPPTSVAPRPGPSAHKPAPAPAEESAVIYVPAVSGGEMMLARKTVDLPEGAGKRAAIQALLDTESEGRRIYPAGTRVVSFASSSAGEATLTLSKEIRDYSGGSAEEVAAVNALVLTTGEAYPGTKKVRIVAEDGELESLGGHLDLTLPVEPDRRSVIKGS